MSKDRVDQIYDLVTDLIRIVGNTNAIVEELREGQDKLERGQARIESIVRQVQEDQKSIFEVLGEHEVAIRTLRRKPV